MFGKKKKADSPRSPRLQNSGSSAPVVRYYRPQQDSSGKQSDSGKNKKQSIFSKKSSINESLAKRQEPKKPSILASLVQSWFGILLIAGALFANTMTSGVAVKTSITSDQAYRSPESYQKIIQDIYGESIMNRGKLTVNSLSMEQKIEASLPEVTQATVVVPLVGRKLDAILSIAPAIFRIQTASNQRLLLSNAGKVMEYEVVRDEQFKSLPWISIVNLNVQPGQTVLTSGELELLSLLISEFDGTELYRPRLESVEFDIVRREMKARFSESGYYAKLTPETNIRQEVGSLVAAIKEFTGSGSGAELPAEYIDVRVGGRVFVK